MSNTPKVTVLMPVYNGERHIAAAIDSILHQTFTDLEFLIVDDFSTDGTCQIIERYGAEDQRILLVENRHQKGIVGALNTGLELARGTYIARMDADDISLPERLQRQVDFMESRPDVGVCGAWMSPLRPTRRKNWFPYPVTHEAIKVHLLFYTAIAHPTVIMRSVLMKKYALRYEEKHKHAEDYSLWVKCADLLTLHNMPEVLLQYRVHDASISREKAIEQAALTMEISRSQLKKLNIHPTDQEEWTHNQAFFGQKERNLRYVKDFSRWLTKLIVANHRCKYCQQGVFVRELFRIYVSVLAGLLRGRGIYLS